jgi:hypothetical protein
MHNAFREYNQAMGIKDRIQEWLAQRVGGVQYPQISSARNTRPPFFKNDMTWERRALIVLVSIVVIVIGLVILAFACLVLWAIITS